MKKYSILAILAVICWTPAMSQQNTLPSRSMTIEGSYNPQATQAGKVLPLPEKTQVKRLEMKAVYATQSNPNMSFHRDPMSVFSSKSNEIKSNAFQGFARFGYGLRNLHDGLLDIDWRITDRDFLKVYGQTDGWSSITEGDWRSRMFNGGIRVAYEHKFKSFNFGVDGGYSHTQFNYRPGYMMDSVKLAASDLLKKINRVDLALSADGKSGIFTWYANIAEKWLFQKGITLNSVPGDNKLESQLNAKAGATVMDNGNVFGVDLGFRYMAYDWTSRSGQKYKNFITATFSPYWTRDYDKVDLFIGADMTVRTAVGQRFMISPLASMNWRLTDRFSLLADMKGGLIENDIRNLESMSPYFSAKDQIIDGYDSFNGSLGVRYNLSAWSTISARLGYRHTLDEVFQTEQDNMIITSGLSQQNSDVLFLKFDADILFSEKGQIRFDFLYSNYMGSYPGFKMDLKPAFDTSLFSKVNILPGLDAMLTYRLMIFNRVAGESMPTVNDLALTFDYDLSKSMSVYATFNKLAGGDFYYYAGYRALKPAFLLGLTCRF